jgi:hypothetical protein
MLENLALAALGRVKPQLDGRRRAWGNRDPLDLRGEEGALDKASAERAVRFTELRRLRIFGQRDKLKANRSKGA